MRVQLEAPFQEEAPVRAEGLPVERGDLVEVTRGYEDPPSVMNFRTVKVPHGGEHGTSSSTKSPEGEAAVPDNYDLQTGRAITLSVRQVKGTSIADYDRDLETAISDLKQMLPSDLSLERTSNEPQKVREKIHGFNQNVIEAVVIVVLMSLLFMEWRSALLVAICIPITIAMALGMSQIIGIDLQQVSIAALIIALGLLVDAPVVAADAINRELAHGRPRGVVQTHRNVAANTRSIVSYLGLSAEDRALLDAFHAAARDDIVTQNIMAIPVNRPVRVVLRSKDVTHSFFVAPLRVKQDAVPGRTNHIVFSADQTSIMLGDCTTLRWALAYVQGMSLDGSAISNPGSRQVCPRMPS